MPSEKRNAPGAASRGVCRSIMAPDASTVVHLDDLRPAALRAWAAACHHLRSLELPPLPPPHVVRALRRRGWW